MSNSTPIRRLIAGVALIAALLAATSASASAGTEARTAPRPKLTLEGHGTWQVRDALGDVVVNGTGDLARRSGRSARVLVAAVVDADDGTLPGPGECESATTTVSAYGGPGIDISMIGMGEVCGFDVQIPTSIVTHVFTGTFEVYDVSTRTRCLLGTDGFFEVRLAVDGSAHVFAIDT
ncbi:hypothetical protein [Dermatobacter hominis]|uniref:hypothetical protein n=1 Tax=Dermatobacter hominis TaxID=2884263 RepID=UPI001D104A4A|nr:hypothetical protein [Dermatobacter hominis]UDY34917.1 hypothetical protein LH044_16460 [Dermatobacter hominis]